jgi:Zn-dependent peptidase ImmA (M78 family)/transcriptional regulator with XRE-family HTH domain
MPAQSPTVKVNPAVLRWARESAGAELAETANRLHTSAETVAKWEAGEEEPTLGKLEILASFLKRPLAVLLLPKPPHEPPVPTDFRALPGTQPPPLSRKTRLMIRRSQRLQRLARDLLSGMGMPPVCAAGTVTLDSDPEKIAAIERERLGVSIQQQQGWRNSVHAFASWRVAVEHLNILVFRFPMALAEARGFSLTSEDPPAIAVNGADAVNARIFTLFHEYAHVLLRTSGLCLFEETALSEDRAIEGFCNHFAGAFLVPLDSLLRDERLVGRRDPATMSDDDLGAIAERFKVSQQVIWRRMAATALVPPEAYWTRVERWRAVRHAPPARPRGGPRPARKCIEQRGRRFASIVFEAKSRDIITYRDMIDYLAVGPQHLRKVEQLLSEGRAR